MKTIVIVFLVLMFSVCLTVLAQTDCPKGQWPDTINKKCVPCPKGEWFHPTERKCTRPVDFSGKVDPIYRHYLFGEQKGFCVDQWCCPEEEDYFGCGENEWKCLIRNGCFIYGE